jgi:hypothetical protein
MRFAEMANVWDSVEGLSGRDRGKVYIHRARAIIHKIETDPEIRAAAVIHGRIDRVYLCQRIECCASVLRQNATIRQLIADLENDLEPRRKAVRASRERSGSPSEPAEPERAMELSRCYEKIDAQAAEIADLRRQKQEALWLICDLPEHGCLPW